MTDKKHKNNKSYYVEETPEKLSYICEQLWEENQKYKRAFEILKDNINMELICSNHDFLCKPVYALDVYANKQIELTKEEYELLEELMKDGTKDN